MELKNFNKSFSFENVDLVKLTQLKNQVFSSKNRYRYYYFIIIALVF